MKVEFPERKGRNQRQPGCAPHSIWIVISSLAFLATGCSTLEVASERPPNIVLFLADDQSWMDSGAYGNKDLPTPNIDQLARNGMRFSHAFTGTAMCAPSRQQLYTGLYPTRSGAYPNHGQVRDGTLSLVHHLRRLGYRVGLLGKEHFGPPSSFSFERLTGRPNTGGPPASKLNLEAVREFISRDPTQPFFLVIASNNPHTPWTEGDRSVFEAGSLAIPGYLVDTPASREALVAYYAEITQLDQELGALLSTLESSGQRENTMVVYTSEQGAALPFAKWTLYDAGIRTALVVSWPGRIAPNSTSDAMVHYVDVAPTLVEAAGGDLEGVDGRSFLPVLRDPATHHRDHVFGIHTNRGIIHGNDYPIRSVRSRRYKLIWNLAPDERFQNLITRPPHDAVLASWKTTAPQRARRYLERHEIEFYDLESDPWELENLAGDPRHAERITAHRALLENWMTVVGDRGIATERDAMRHVNPKILDRIRKRFGENAVPPPAPPR